MHSNTASGSLSGARRATGCATLFRVTRPFSSLVFAVLLLAWAASSLAGTRAAAVDLPFVPDPDAEDAATLSGSTWVELGPGFTLRVQQIDGAERLAYIENVTGLSIDPFASPVDQAPRFESFLMQIENVGAGILVFRSQQCLLKGRTTEILIPFSMETMRATYGMVGQKMQPAYQRAGAAMLPTSRDLTVGEAIAGLLVYPKVNPKTKRFHLEIQITTSAGDVVTVNAPYRRLKKKELQVEP